MKRKNFECPCCLNLTLRRGDSYEICPVCFWEDSGDGEDGPNRISLEDARKNYAKIGACDTKCVPHVRKPLKSEIPNQVK